MATTGTSVKRGRKPKLSNTLESLKPVIERAVEFSPGCNLFASGQGDDSMTMKRKAPVGRRTARVIPRLSDQNRCAHVRSPMDMIRQGWSARRFQAKQQWSRMSS